MLSKRGLLVQVRVQKKSIPRRLFPKRGFAVQVSIRDGVGEGGGPKWKFRREGGIGWCPEALGVPVATMWSTQGQQGARGKPKTARFVSRADCLVLRT